MNPLIEELIDLLFVLAEKPHDPRRIRALALRAQLGATVMHVEDVPLP